MTLRVFWLKCGPNRGNFGDRLTPLLLDYLNVRYRWAPAEEADFFGIGSICHKVPDGFRGAVWSAGSIGQSQENCFSSATILALRGQLTRRQTRCRNNDTMAIGDGGLLCNLVAPKSKKRYRLGVIPHYVDAGDPEIREFVSRNRGVCLIDVCEPPLEVIRRISQCHFILSSSLHGLVVADSLGVPNRWMNSRRQLYGGHFKFHDYYTAFGVEAAEPLRLEPNEGLEDLLAHAADYRRPGIGGIQRGLLNCLAGFLGTAGQSAWHVLSSPRDERAAILEKRVSDVSAEGTGPASVSRRPEEQTGNAHAGTSDSLASGAVPLEHVAPLLRQCAERRGRFFAASLDALEDLWRRGIFHRDVRVANIFLAGERVVFHNFGWSVPRESESLRLPSVEQEPELISRDLTGLVESFAAITPPEDERMWAAINWVVQQGERGRRCDAATVRLLVESASSAPDGSSQDASRPLLDTSRKLIGELLSSVDAVRNQYAKEKKKNQQLADQLWRCEVERAIDEICSVVPHGSTFILLDQGAWSDFFFLGRQMISYPERDGQFAGLPCDGRTAANEMLRLADLGATHFAVPTENLWCLDCYPELAKMLGDTASVIHTSMRLQIHKFKERRQESVA